MSLNRLERFCCSDYQLQGSCEFSMFSLTTFHYAMSFKQDNSNLAGSKNLPHYITTLLKLWKDYLMLSFPLLASSTLGHSPESTEVVAVVNSSCTT